MVKSKEKLYNLLRSLFPYGDVTFPPISNFSYCPCSSFQLLACFDRTFTLFDDSRIRYVEDGPDYVIRFEGTLKDGWTSCRRYEFKLIKK